MSGEDPTLPTDESGLCGLVYPVWRKRRKKLYNILHFTKRFYIFCSYSVLIFQKIQIESFLYFFSSKITLALARVLPNDHQEGQNFRRTILSF